MSRLVVGWVACLSMVLSGCWGDDAYILEGTVVQVNGATEVVVAHDDIKGLMGAMTMPFEVRDPSMLEDVEPGDRIVARLMIERQGTYLDRLRVTGHGVAPAPVEIPPDTLRSGAMLPRFDIQVEDGTVVAVGDGQDKATALAFMYTRCHMPEFCPALVARFQALQEAVGADARLVAVTLDPEHDTVAVLREFGQRAGARPEVWRFGRLPPDDLERLGFLAALSVTNDGAEIVHGARLLVLDRDGRLVERYDDNRWPVDRVVDQLRTGGPAASAGMDGTVTP